MFHFFNLVNPESMGCIHPVILSYVPEKIREKGGSWEVGDVCLK